MFLTVPAPLRNVCKLSCWNVSGLKNSAFGYKLNNPDFPNQLKDCDIISFSEIWGYDVVDIPDFQVIAMSPPRKRNTKRSGRCSGGILVAVKKFLTSYVALVKQTSNYIWCRIDNNLFQTEKDILLCSTFYMPYRIKSLLKIYETAKQFSFVSVGNILIN